LSESFTKVKVTIYVPTAEKPWISATHA